MAISMSLEGMASLVDKSLVRVGRERCRAALPDAGDHSRVRREQLAASGEAATLREVHAAYFLSLAERGKPSMYGTGQRTWLRRLEAEHPNLRAALAALAASDGHEMHMRLVANLALFWFLRGHFAEGQANLERALAHAVAPTPERAEALTGLGRIVTGLGDFLPARSGYGRAKNWLARSMSRPFSGRRSSSVGSWRTGRATTNGPFRFTRQPSPSRASATMPRPPVSRCQSLSDDAYRRGDLESSERLAEESIALLRSAGDEWALGLVLTNIGAVALAWGDTPRAIAAYQEALDLGLGIDADWVIASALAGFAAVAAARGEHPAAAKLLGATETMREASHQDRLSNHAHHTQTTQTVRAALGETAFAAAWNDGRALPAEEAIDLPRVLGLVEESASPFFLPGPA